MTKKNPKIVARIGKNQTFWLELERLDLPWVVMVSVMVCGPMEYQLGCHDKGKESSPWIVLEELPKIRFWAMSRVWMVVPLGEVTDHWPLGLMDISELFLIVGCKLNRCQVSTIKGGEKSCIWRSIGRLPEGLIVRMIRDEIAGLIWDKLSLVWVSLVLKTSAK